MFDIFGTTPYGNADEKDSYEEKKDKGEYNDYIDTWSCYDGTKYLTIKFLDVYSYRPFTHSRDNKPQHMYDESDIELIEFPEKTKRTKEEILKDLRRIAKRHFEDRGEYKDYINTDSYFDGTKYLAIQFLDVHSDKPFKHSRDNKPQHIFNESDIELIEFPKKTIRPKEEILKDLRRITKEHLLGYQNKENEETLEDKIEEVKKEIYYFFEREYGTDLSYEEFSKNFETENPNLVVGIAYTTTEDGKHEIQFNYDLESCKGIQYVDDIVVYENDFMKECGNDRIKALDAIKEEIICGLFDDYVYLDENDLVEAGFVVRDDGSMYFKTENKEKHMNLSR